jgi:lysophospholipase L1-like esterase
VYEEGVSADHVRPRRAALAALAVLIAMLAGTSAAAGAIATRSATAVSPVTPSSPVTRGSGYVALGDSVTFGYQEPKVTPPPDYLRAASFRGYPEQLGTELHLKVANFACPGETAVSLVDATAPSFGCENAYRRAFPLHQRYRGSQLAAAVTYLRRHPGVRLVSLMIGANDEFRCQRMTKDACTSPAEQKATLAAVAASVRRILSGVRNAAHYNGQIVVLGYYSLNYTSPTINAIIRALNQAQAAGARPFHVRFADAYGGWRTAAVRFGRQPCLAGLLTQLGSYGTCGVHPSYAGQALLAKAVAAATRL